MQRVINEFELQAVLSFIKPVLPLLHDALKTESELWERIEPAQTPGASIHATFKPFAPVPRHVARDVHYIMKTLSKKTDASANKYEWMNVHGAVLVWDHFIA